MEDGRFKVDTKGFKVQMSEMPLWRLIQEIVSNAFDEKSVKEITCIVNRSLSNDKDINVFVQDNGNGFRDVKDIYTLYKDSYKRVNSRQRGRFNLGDKQFFAVAKTGSVETGTNKVKFYKDTRKVLIDLPKIDGVIVEGIFESSESVDAIVTELHNVIVPKGVVYTINDVEVSHVEPIKEFKAVLRTPIASGINQKLVQIKQKTKVVLYEKYGSEAKPVLMELGVPVQELEENINWNIDVRQKVPITSSRDVVSDKYLQTLYAEVLDNSLDLITSENAGSNWVGDAMKNCDESSTRTVLEKVYGTDKMMIESSNDHRANEKAQDAGYVLVKSGTFDKDVMSNISKEQGIIQYAGKVFETTFGDAKPITLTPALDRFAQIVEAVGQDVTKRPVRCEFFSMVDGAEVANCMGVVVSWNVGRLGKRFFEVWSNKASEILIHELAHIIDSSDCGQYSHYKSEFIDALQKIAGRVAEKGIQHWIKPIEVKQ